MLGYRYTCRRNAYMRIRQSLGKTKQRMILDLNQSNPSSFHICTRTHNRTIIEPPSQICLYPELPNPPNPRDPVRLQGCQGDFSVISQVISVTIGVHGFHFRMNRAGRSRSLCGKGEENLPLGYYVSWDILIPS